MQLGGRRVVAVRGARQRWATRLRLLLGIALTAALTGVLAPTAGADPSWSVRSTFPPPPGTAQVSCATPTSCEAVPGYTGPDGRQAIIGRSSTSGWHYQQLPAGFGSVTDVSCAPGTTACEVVGTGSTANTGAVAGTTDGGVTWQLQALPSAVGPLSFVSCASSSTCLVLGEGPFGTVALRTSDGGQLWRSASFPGGGNPAGLSCPSARFCMATVPPPEISGAPPRIYTSTTNGRQWQQLTLPANVPGVYGVSCPTTTTCEVATGSTQALATTDAGSSWTLQTIAPPPGGRSSLGFSQVSCATRTFCETAGILSYMTVPSAVVYGTNDGGASWHEQRLRSGGKRISGLSGVSCRASSCTAAAGNFLFVTDDSGATWNMATLPGVAALTGVACSSSSQCQLVGQGATKAVAMITTDAGATWKAQRVPPHVTFGGPGDTQLCGAVCPHITCAPSHLCEAWGFDALYSAAVVGSVDGGPWERQTLPPGLREILGMSCASSTQCEAVAADESGAGLLLGTTDGGATWQRQSLPRAVPALAVGGTLYQPVSCVPDTSVCSIMTSTNTRELMLRTSDMGQTWRVRYLPAPVDHVYSIACPTSSVCYVGSQSGTSSLAAMKTTDGGESWSPVDLPVEARSFDGGISCVAVTTCEAFGFNPDSGLFGTTDGTTWSEQAPPSGSGFFWDPWCVASTTCYGLAANTVTGSAQSANSVIAYG